MATKCTYTLGENETSHHLKSMNQSSGALNKNDFNKIITLVLCQNLYCIENKNLTINRTKKDSCNLLGAKLRQLFLLNNVELNCGFKSNLIVVNK